jgi:hypothetical protein
LPLSWHEFQALQHRLRTPPWWKSAIHVTWLASDSLNERNIRLRIAPRFNPSGHRSAQAWGGSTASDGRLVEHTMQPIAFPVAT